MTPLTEEISRILLRSVNPNTVSPSRKSEFIPAASAFLTALLLSLTAPASSNAQAVASNGPTLIHPYTNSPTSVNLTNGTRVGLTNYFRVINPGYYSNNPTLMSNAVAVNSSVGNFLIQLFPTNAPATVANFLGYVNSGRYENLLVQRSVPGFVLQMGGFGLDVSQSTGTFFPAIPAFAPVNSEVSLSNNRGTLAMALGSNPDGSYNTNSGTSQWFINLTNNVNLDPDFSVFGKVIGNGMSIVDYIAGLEVKNLNQYVGLPYGSANWSNGPLADVPFTGTNITSTSQLIVVTNIFPIQGELPYFAVSSDTNAFIPQINGNNLDVSFVAYPTNPTTTKNLATITVFASDTNGNISNFSFKVYPEKPGTNNVINFPAIPPQPYSTNQFYITNWPTSSGGVPVNITQFTGPLRVTTNGIPYFSGLGTITLTAHTQTNANINLNYTPAPPVTISFQVVPGTPPLGSFAIPTQTLGVSKFQIPAPSSPSLGGYTYTSSNTNVAVVVGNKVIIVGVGTATITVNQAAKGNYASSSKSTVLNVYASNPVLGPLSVPPQTYSNNASFYLTNPTSSSPGTFSYTSGNPNVATISSNRVTIVGAGVATITATQSPYTTPGGSNAIPYNLYNSASTKAILTVAKSSQTVSFSQQPTNSLPYAPLTNQASRFGLKARATSGEPITYSSSQTNVVSVLGTNATINGIGTAIITATAAANNNYTAAQNKFTITIVRATPALGAFSITTKNLGTAPFPLTPPTSPSTGAFTFTSSDTNVATIAGRIVTIKGAGTATITAIQAAQGNYGTNSKSTDFTVNPL